MHCVPMPQTVYCVQALCQQCMCTVFRTYASNVYALCSGHMPTMSMHCVQDLCQQCLCTVFRTYANNVCALCSGPMPAAHAEQGLGEARATACGLAHRQRVRVGSPQSLQSLLHLLLVSHRSFLASLSSSVPLCPSLSPSLLSSLSLSVSSVLIYHPAYCLFLLSWSVAALFCLPCRRLFLCAPGLSPFLLSLLSPSVQDYIVTVCSLCPGLSPSVLSSVPPSVPSVLDYRRPFCPQCHRRFPLSWSIAVRSVPCVTVCSLCPGLSPSVLSPVSPWYCSFCSGQPPAGLCRQYTCHILFPQRPTCLKSPCVLIHYTVLYYTILYYTLSTFLSSSLQENVYHSVLLSKAMTRQSQTCVQLQSLRKLPWS